MDLCLLLLLVLLHSLCQCDLAHWRLFRLRGLLRPLGLALGVKKASILCPLISQLLEIRPKLSIFHFHLVFAIQGHFFGTGFSNRRTCQLFFQAFHMKHFRFSGIRITYKILLVMQQGTPRFYCIFIYVFMKKPSLCSLPQRQRLVCSWCSIRTSIFRPLGQTHSSLNMAGHFLAKREIIQQQHKMTITQRFYDIVIYHRTSN